MDLYFYDKLNKYSTDGKGFVSMSRRVRINAVIAEYYERLGEENEDVLITRGSKTESMRLLMSRRSNRVLSCGRFIDTVRFKEFGIHEVKSIKLCGDKFCGNCQKRLANLREKRYTPLLDELSKRFDMYHISFTVPNVSGLFLPKAVEDILDGFAKLVKYLDGRKKIRGLSFGGIGYIGAIRSLEITHNETKQTYHPHLHCIFAFKKGLNLDQPKTIVNDFSYDRGRLRDKWSAFEVFIQRLWYLCYERQRVTKSAIEASPGYSCKVNRANGNYHQIFKYAIKGLLDDKRVRQLKSKGQKIDVELTYEEFRDLYFALEGRRAMQGYGCFYGLKFDDGDLKAPEQNDLEIRWIINELQKLDEGEFVSEKLASVIENIIKKHELYFSRDTVREDVDSFKGDD